MTTAITVSREEVESLKSQWLSDPCYDIAAVGSDPGWEAWADELKSFQTAQYALWEEARQKEVREKAESLGIPDNPTLAAYIMRLEARIDRLSHELNRHVNSD